MKTDQLQNVIPFPKKISTEDNDKILFNNNKELRKYSFKIILDHLFSRACAEIENGQGESLYNLLTTLSKKLENDPYDKKKILEKILWDLQNKKIFH